MIQMIAPCGVNCEVCMAHLRDKKKCPGCLSSEDEKKSIHCVKCTIKFCAEHEKIDFIHCFDCRKFPCSRLKQLDKRYTTNYHTGLIDNLKQIKEKGIDKFLAAEKIKWTCPHCGSILCVHRDICDNCKIAYR